MTRHHTLRALALVVAGLFATTDARALPFQTTATIPGLGSANTMQYTLDRPSPLADVSNNVYVVAFQSTLNGVAGTSFCADVVNALSVPGSYTAVVEAISAPYLEAAQIAHRWANQLSALASSVGVSLAEATSGVQLAIWKNIYDDPAGVGVISFGRALSANEQLAYDRAVDQTQWTGVGDTVLLRLTNAAGGTAQGQLFTPPGSAVPEPASFLTFGVGALLIARTLRSRPARG